MFFLLHTFLDPHYPMERVVLLADMDAFFASVEQAVNPSLKGKPVIVVGREKVRRSVVCAASYEAKRKGIDSGMPSFQAMKILPQAIFIPADNSKYVYVSQQIHHHLHKFSLPVQRLSIDEFLMDLSSLSSPWKEGKIIAQQIKDMVRSEFSITCTVGISTSLLLAKVACKMAKPDGLKLLTPQEWMELRKEWEVDKIPGIGNKLKEKLHSIGIKTWEDLSTTPLIVLKEAFKKEGIRLYFLGKGKDPIDPFPQTFLPPRSIGHSYTFPSWIGEEEIRGWVRLLSEMISMRLRKERLAGKVVKVFAQLKEGNFSRQKNFRTPTSSGKEIAYRALYILSPLKRRKIKSLGITLSSLSPFQNNLLFSSLKKEETIEKIMQEINQKWGEWTIFPASILLKERKSPKYPFITPNRHDFCLNVK